MTQGTRALAHTYLNRGRAALRAGDLAHAHAALVQAVKLDDTLAAAHYELGNTRRRAGQAKSAETSLQAAIQRDPTLVDAYVSLAFLYHEHGAHTQAGATLMALVTVKNHDIKLHRQMGALLADFDNYVEAARVFERLSELSPDTAAVYERLGQMYQKLGRYEQAANAFERCIALEPDAGAAYLLLAHTRRIQASDADLVENLEQTLTRPHLSQDTVTCLHFALGKLYDDLDRYTQAFRHFQAGNALKAAQQSFDRDALKHQVETNKQLFDKGFFEQVKQQRPRAGPRPVFLVGMLRSGTTLVERILARHPKVYGAGELDLLDALATRTSQLTGAAYPECVFRLTPALAAQLSSEYKARWPQEARRAVMVVDKNPLNFIHLALAALVLPESRFIHCIRSPLDTCLSIYFQNFAHTRNSYAYNMDDLIYFYQKYREMMAHWDRSLGARIYPLRYETLVAQPERSSRELIAALNLDWHPDCLEPHRHTASISTASVWQARQPIYQRSVQRWRNYRMHIQALIDAFGER